MRCALLFVPLLLGACNAAPQSVVLTLEPSTPTTQDELALNIEGAGDPDGDPVNTTVTWFMDGDHHGQYDDAQTIPPAATSKHQTWRAYVVPDDGSLEGPASAVEVTILNSPPVVELALSPLVPLTEDDVESSLILISDADGDDVTVVYQWYLGGEPTSHDQPTLPAAATERGQVWTLEVIPHDGDEAGETVSASVNIDNTAPVIDSVSLWPEAPYENDSITATVEARDDDSDPITLGYAWYVNGKLVLEGAEPSLTGVHFDKHQRVHVEVRGNDGFIDGEALASSALTVQNSAPSITGVSLVPEEIREETLVSCSPQGYHDADGDEAEYSYVWEVDGGVVSTGSTLDGTWFDESQTVKCTATPSDGEATGTAFTSVLATVQNTPPVLASATLSTTAPVEGDTVTVTLGALTDVDGDPTTVRYAWFVDGAQVSTSSSIDSTFFDKHQEIYVEVTPNDGDEDGATVPSIVATALNTAPVIDQLGFSSSVLYTDDLATLDVDSSDADGDDVSVAFVWQVDGVPVAESGDTLSGASWFDKGQTIVVTATPHDGEVDGTPSAVERLVSNTAPTAPTVYITPTVPDGYDDSLLCSVAIEAMDADGDPLTYAASWAANGSLFTGGTDSTTFFADTIPAGTSAGGEVWTCRVSANDGEEDGGVGEDEVTIGGAYLRDDFTVDYGWDMGTSTGFTITGGALEWIVDWDWPASGEVISYEFEPLQGGFILEFDIRVDSMEEDSMGGGYGLWLGLRESMSRSEGVFFKFSDCYTSCDTRDWRVSGTGLYAFDGVYGEEYHFYIEFEEGYFSTSGKARLFTQAYDHAGTLVDENTTAWYDDYEFTFRYLSISVGGEMGTSSICCNGSGIIDNLELRAWED